MKILVCDTAVKKRYGDIKKILDESEYSGSTVYVTRSRREASHIIKDEKPDLMVIGYSRSKNGDGNKTLEFIKNHSEIPAIVIDNLWDKLSVKVWDLNARPLYRDEIDDLPVEIYHILNPAKPDPGSKIQKISYDPLKKAFSQA